MRVSCFGCEIFESFPPIEKLRMFWDIWFMFHDNRAIYFQNAIEAIGQGKREEYLNCIICSEKTPGGHGVYEQTLYADRLEKIKRWFNIKALLASKSRAEREHGKLMLAEDKMEEIGAWSNEYYGISQRPYFNDSLADQISEEEAGLLFLQDLRLKRRHGYYYGLDLVVNLEHEFDRLVDSFKKVIKEKQHEYMKEIHKADGRLKTPYFKLWDKYLLAYMLYKKKVPPHLFNPEWEINGKITVGKVANLIFEGEAGDIEQKARDYIKEAKRLIKQAETREGLFGLCV